MATIQDRLNVITSDPNYLCHELYPSKIEHGIEVLIVYYLNNNGQATQNMEVWVVPNANMENFLSQTAYPVNVTISSNIQQVIATYKRDIRRVIR